jgi:catechol 2,3-dioxygenase-like lactoylglutathione lyase family enzyme
MLQDGLADVVAIEPVATPGMGRAHGRARRAVDQALEQCRRCGPSPACPGPRAFLQHGSDLVPHPATDESGLHHIAFTLESLGDLLETYARLKTKGITPFWCINHGVTTSMYYRDPDNNQVELLIDNFAIARDGQAFMKSPSFVENPIGKEYDPHNFVARFRAGATAKELLAV